MAEAVPFFVGVIRIEIGFDFNSFFLKLWLFLDLNFTPL
jgi:hypothetical protein